MNDSRDQHAPATQPATTLLDEIRVLQRDLAEAGDALALIEHAPTGLIELNTRLEVLHANDAARSLLLAQRSGETLLGQNLSALIHPDSREPFDRTWREFMNGAAHRSEILQVQVSGSSRYIRITLNRLDDRLFAWIEDRSENRALGTQIKQARAPAREFLHELNNALTAGSGYLDLAQSLVERPPEPARNNPERLRHYLQEIRRSLARTENLIAGAKTTAPPGPESGNLMRRHILLVDDEEPILKLLAELLRQHGYKVTAVAEGRRALRYFEGRCGEIDLVILDHVMPEISGIGLATEMLARSPTMPIVLCTDDDKLIDAQRAGQIHIRHFLSKPIDMNTLVEMVADLLERRDAEAG